jgi:hypothetical protein
LAPTVGIAATGFCYPGGILQLFSTARSANFTAADSSSQIGIKLSSVSRGICAVTDLDQQVEVPIGIMEQNIHTNQISWSKEAIYYWIKIQEYKRMCQ